MGAMLFVLLVLLLLHLRFFDLDHLDHLRGVGDLLSSLPLLCLADANADAYADANHDHEDDHDNDACADRRCRCTRTQAFAELGLAAVEVVVEAVGVVLRNGQGSQDAEVVLLAREAPDAVNLVPCAGERDHSRVLGSTAWTHVFGAAFRCLRSDAREGGLGAVDGHLGDPVALFDVGRRAIDFQSRVFDHDAVVVQLHLLCDLATRPDAKGCACTHDLRVCEAGFDLDEDVLVRDRLPLGGVLGDRRFFVVDKPACLKAGLRRHCSHRGCGEES
jgi:hypothetical protein